MNATHYARAGAVLFLLHSRPSEPLSGQAASMPARDVAGVKLGMTGAEALARLSTYGRDLTNWAVTQGTFTFPQDPARTQYLVHIDATGTREDAMEVYQFELSPAPPPAPSVVVTMHRTIAYNQDRVDTLIVKALSARYGSTPRTQKGARISLAWQYRADGTALPAPATCITNPTDVASSPTGSPHLHARDLKALSAQCGSYTVASVTGAGGPNLVSDVAILVHDASFELARAAPMDAYVASLSDEARKKQLNDAAKRSTP